MDDILITKASGEKESFKEAKLKKSLQRAHADEKTIRQIVKQIKEFLYDGISTKEIYQKAFTLLHKQAHHVAARYNLKRAIMGLGPSGFPFEKYVAEILRYEGYSVFVGIIVQGECVKHEVDVVAEKEDKHFMVECKFHNQPGHTTDVKIPLYIDSRFRDIERQWKRLPEHGTKFHQGWVVTNTRFTTDAIQYGVCAGLYMLGWDYPNKGSLKELIDKAGLHPVTALTTLSSAEKARLLEKKIVLCREVFEAPALLQSIGIKPNKLKIILEEAESLCQNK